MPLGLVVFSKIMMRPPLSPTESIFPCLSKVMADKRSCLAIAVGSGSPRLLRLVKFSGSITSFREPSLLETLRGETRLLFVSEPVVEAEDDMPLEAAEVFISILLPNLRVGETPACATLRLKD